VTKLKIQIKLFIPCEQLKIEMNQKYSVQVVEGEIDEDEEEINCNADEKSSIEPLKIEDDSCTFNLI